MKDDYLNKLHSEILSIVDYFHSFCKKNNLKYYMVGGSILGAFRHKGFIPWDDDFDVCMPRKDFEKFVRIFPKKNTDQFRLNWINTNKKYDKQFAKIYKNGTLFLEEGLPPNTLDYYGIFIDIFPLDTTTGISRRLEFRRKLFFKIVSLQYLKLFPSKRKIVKIFLKLVPSKLIFHFEKIICASFYVGKKNYFTRFGSQYSTERITTPISWYGNGSLYEFEGREYYGPDNAFEVLKTLYGDHFMSLPPKDKRRTHYPIKVVFGDGSTALFGKTQVKVTPNDTLF